jgi:hypothetical protein
VLLTLVDGDMQGWIVKDGFRDSDEPFLHRLRVEVFVGIYVCMCVCMYIHTYVHTYYVLIKPPMPYITSSPLCLLRGFAS